MKPPSASPHPQSRGVALLVALAALILTITAAASLARMAATASTSRRLNKAEQIANTLLPAAEEPIQHWLRHDSSSTVLPPDATRPEFQVFHSTWTAAGLEHELTITAYDQTGMVPIQMARNGGALRTSLSSEALDAVDALDKAQLTQPGLDLFESTSLPIFPDPSNPDTGSLGALLATHPSNQSNRTGSIARININTAPIPLLESAMQLTGIDAMGRILEARTAGEPASINNLSLQTNTGDTRIHLIASSPAWAMRIDARIGSLRRSWWTVYVHSSSSWEAVQRLAIDE